MKYVFPFFVLNTEFYVRIKFFLSLFQFGPPKTCEDYPAYQLVGPLGNLGVIVSCSTALQKELGDNIFIKTITVKPLV